MLDHIVTALISIGLGGLLSGYLVQKWQQKNWTRQQQFFGQEKEYAELRDLYPELEISIGKRIYSTRKMFWAVKSGDAQLVSFAKTDYQNTVKDWNERLHGFYAKLKIFAKFDYAKHLEDSIQSPFQKLGVLLDEQIRSVEADRPQNPAALYKIQQYLNSINTENTRFIRNLLRAVEMKRNAVYLGRTLPYHLEYIEQYSNVELIKSIFIRNVDSHAILCPPSDIRFPTLPIFKRPWIH